MQHNTVKKTGSGSILACMIHLDTMWSVVRCSRVSPEEPRGLHRIGAGRQDGAQNWSRLTVAQKNLFYN